MLRRLLKPLVRRLRWLLWFAATLIVVAWLVELIATGKPGFVAQWLVPAALVALLATRLLQRKFWRLPNPEDRDTKIVVVGAGPAGLSAAYFLKQQGDRCGRAAGD